MRTQQQAEKAEQQRIKNLVLNYDLTDDQQDGELPNFHYVQSQSSRNHGQVRLVGTGSLNSKVYAKCQGQSQRSTTSGEENHSPHSTSPPSDDAIHHQGSLTDETGSFDTLHGAPRYDKSGNTRSKQRARQLKLSDVEWYGSKSAVSTPSSERQEGQASLDQYVVDKKQSMRGGRGGRGGDFGTRRGSAHALALGSKG